MTKKLTEAQLIASKERNRRYRKTPKGKATYAAYCKSERGKEVARNKQRKYRLTEKGKAAMKRWRKKQKRAKNETSS